MTASTKARSSAKLIRQSKVACQYPGVLEKTFVAVMTRGKSEATVWCEEAIEQDGGGTDVSEEEVGGPYRRIVQWGAEKTRWGGIEANKLSWVIGRLVERFSG